MRKTHCKSCFYLVRHLLSQTRLVKCEVFVKGTIGIDWPKYILSEFRQYGCVARKVLIQTTWIKEISMFLLKLLYVPPLHRCMLFSPTPSLFVFHNTEILKYTYMNTAIIIHLTDCYKHCWWRASFRRVVLLSSETFQIATEYLNLNSFLSW